MPIDTIKKLVPAFAIFSFCFSFPTQGYSEKTEALSKRELRGRKIEAFEAKEDVAYFDAKKKITAQLSNGDEERYKDLRGSFGKVLLHDSDNLINHKAHRSLLKALSSHKNSDFNKIILGEGLVPPGKSRVLLTNPQSSLAYSLSSCDPWINAIPPAPRFASNESAGEMVELYWTALCRDVPFNEFESDLTVASAVADLNTLKDFKGPTIDGVVTPHTFMRGNLEGDLIGPYISQFLYQTIPYGPITVSQTITVPAPGIENDFLTNLAAWSIVINGGLTSDSIVTDGTTFIRTPRDLTAYVHTDFSGQAATNAALILTSYGSSALDPNNPYLNNPTQIGAVTYGQPHVLYLVQAAAEESLKAAFFCKWQVNRRLRPEEFGFFVNAQKGGSDYGISSQLMDSPVLPRIYSTYGSYLMPTAYPEGCPSHPSYPAGHAVYLGATVTILKAFYNESFAIPNPLMPNADNTSLVSYPGTLYIGDELNKLASNIALGRDMAGIHYRSDGYYGLLLGEKIAISILKNESFLFNEKFEGFHLTKFNGEKILVGGKKKVSKPRDLLSP